MGLRDVVTLEFPPRRPSDFDNNQHGLAEFLLDRKTQCLQEELERAKLQQAANRDRATALQWQLQAPFGPAISCLLRQSAELANFS